MLLNAAGLSKSFGDNLLFQDVSFNVEQGDIIGLIGSNGTGKTTLFNIISGEENCDSGAVIRSSGVSVGVLRQHACEGSTKSAFDETLSVFEPLILLENEIEKVNLMLYTCQSTELIEKQQRLQEKYEREGGLTYRSRTDSALSGLGFSEEEKRLPVSALSGGQRSKIELCKLLLSKPDVILLDEPTNHLDIESIEWLDNYIKNIKSAVMIISHDRYFLDRVATKIFEISSGKVNCYNGNYTKYCAVKELRQETVRRNYENTMQEVERIEKIIEQQRRWNREKNIKTAENKQKMIDRLLKDLEIPESEKQGMSLSFTANTRSGDEVLKAENLSKSYDGKCLYKDVSFKVMRGQRIFIIGPNGCGKTTLMRQLLDKTAVQYGTGVKAGYFDQHGQNLNRNNTVFKEVRDAYPSLSDTAIRSALAMFLFRGDEVFKVIEDLSGGERARVALCKLMLGHDNLLFLDEPTNHLDIDSRETLEETLEDYDGTLICISHDRYLINRLATEIWYFDGELLKKLSGKYDDYLSFLETKEKVVLEKAESKNKNEYLKKKEDASKKRKLKTAFSKCEQEISRLEDEIAATLKEIEDPENAADYIKMTELTKKQEELEEMLSEQMSLWEKLGVELEGAE